MGEVTRDSERSSRPSAPIPARATFRAGSGMARTLPANRAYRLAVCNN